MNTVRERIVTEYTVAEYRYIAAVCLRKAVEALGDAKLSRLLRAARIDEADANDELTIARKTCEDNGTPVNPSPILSLL